MYSVRYIVYGVVAVVLTACAATNSLPVVDDAYYRPAESSYSSDSSDSRTGATGSPGSTIEYLNVQDTTVTIRIKR